VKDAVQDAASLEEVPIQSPKVRLWSKNLRFFFQPQVKDAVQDAAVLEEVLRMLLEIINSCILLANIIQPPG
jgi:hypothetical protein